MTESIYIFNDGSTGSKLLQSELKDEYSIKTVNVSGNDIEQWFSKIEPDNKIFLHLCYEEINAGHIREILQGLESKGFRNKIVLPYEGLDKKTMEKRARQQGIGESKIGVNTNEISNIINTVSEIIPNVHELSGNIGKDDETKKYNKRKKVWKL